MLPVGPADVPGFICFFLCSLDRCRKMYENTVCLTDAEEVMSVAVLLLAMVSGQCLFYSCVRLCMDLCFVFC